MADVYIVDAVRTPMGRRNGGLSDLHPVDLGAHAITALVDRTGIDPEAVDDVIFGCISQIGSQAWNIARNSWLAAGLPESVPAVTIDRQCGSSQQAVHFGAQGILAGSYDVVVAGGIEQMSLVPLNCSAELGPQLGVGFPFESEGWIKRYGDGKVHQFFAGQRIAEHWGIARDEMERFALRSHQRANRAWNEGRFDREVVPCNGLEKDETIRADTSLEKMATLKPIQEGGLITAATACQVADGAATVLLASEAAVKRHGLTPRARIHSMVAVGSDPWLLLTGPIPATKKALASGGLEVDDIDLFECNEAFASVVLAWAADTGADPERTNVNGGAIALGHALGATGTRLLTTLLHELERTGGRYGLETVCEGGGLANATIIERLA
jgi:acetyl-CoA C-acetyltransferase